MIRHLAALLSCVAIAQSVTAAPVTEVHYVMGTYFSITVDRVADAPARAAMRRCFSEARRLDAIFSRYQSDSELSRVNAATSPRIRLSADLARLLARSLALQSATDGAFDVTLGALTAPEANTVNPGTTSSTSPAIRTRLVGRDLERGQPGARLDFDGIAKGYAVDRCVASLRKDRITHALVSLGESSQYALGSWEIAVRGIDPETTVGRIRLDDRALSVSVVFGHSRTVAGRRVGHIIDPASRVPLDRNALALIVARTATDAEAYSKAVLIWSARRTQPLRARLDRHREIDAAIYIDPDQTLLWHTDAFGFRPSAPRSLQPTEEPLL